MSLTPQERKLARHALGLPNINRCSYRNRFSASRNTADCDAWEKMRAGGLADVFAYSETGKHFHLTLAGAVLAIEPGERLDREDFPDAT